MIAAVMVNSNLLHSTPPLATYSRWKEGMGGSRDQPLGTPMASPEAWLEIQLVERS
jgi:hypothetical protein